MYPIACQSSIRGPFGGNPIHGHRTPPPRPFQLSGREIHRSGPLYGLLRVYLGPNPFYREKRLRGHSGALRGYVKPFCTERRQPEVAQGRATGGRQLARARISGTSAKRQDGALPGVAGARFMFRAGLGGIRGFFTDFSVAQRSGLIGFLTPSSAAQRSGQIGSLTPSNAAQRSGQTGSLTDLSGALQKRILFFVYAGQEEKGAKRGEKG